MREINLERLRAINMEKTGQQFVPLKNEILNRFLEVNKNFADPMIKLLNVSIDDQEMG